MKNQNIRDNEEDYLTLRELINTLKGFWKLLSFSTFLGLFFASIYLISMPNNYRGVMQFHVAQLPINPFNHEVSSFFFPEDVNALVSRLKIPSSFSLEEVKACGFDGEDVPKEQLVKLLRVTTSKDSSSLVELNIALPSEEQTTNCLEALFKHIKIYQDNLIDGYVIESKNMIKEYDFRIKSNDKKIHQSKLVNADYGTLNLQTQNDVLREKIYRLERFLAVKEVFSAKLTAPIYVSSKPISPNRIIILLAGGVMGFLVALFFIGFRRIYMLLFQSIE